MESYQVGYTLVLTALQVEVVAMMPAMHFTDGLMAHLSITAILKDSLKVECLFHHIMMVE